MNSELKILLIEDMPGDAELVSYEIKKSKIQFNSKLISTREGYLSALAEFKPDIVISDFTLPQFTGLEALELRNENNPNIPFILVTGTLNEEIAVECMKAGADDYILKNNLSRLGPAVQNAIKKIRLIEEKTMAELALRESTERYRRLVEQSPDAIAVHYEGRFIFVNPAAVNLLGACDPDQLIDKPLLEIIHPDSREKVIERINTVREGNEAPVFEEKFLKFDGTVIDVEVLGIPYPYQGGIASQLIVRDITERKKAELALKTSEEKYRAIFENVQDVYFELTMDGIILEVSPSIEAFSKGLYSREDVIGLSMDEFYYNSKDSITVLNTLREKGYITDTEIIIRNRDGSRIYTSTSSRIILDDNGQPVKITGSLRDISARKRDEEAIENERRLLRTVIDNLPDNIYVKDSNARKIMANIADVKYLGYEAEEMIIGKTDLETIPGEAGIRGYEDDINILKSGVAVIEKEEDFITSRGERRWLLTTKVPLIDKVGRVTGLVGIGHDITRRKKIEEELFNAKVKAEEGDRLKTAFLHNISHEIRTPMNAIVGFSALLTEPEVDEESRKSFIDTIVQSSNHLLSIINDIVDVSNIEANLVKVENKETNILALANSVLKQFTPQAEKKSLLLVYDNRLPDGFENIISDPVKIKQILLNLVSNAVKFTDSGQITVCVALRESFIEFCVTDTGIGIPEEHHSRIFDRFYQVQSTLSKLYQGTGLGLAISKSYAKLLGGDIWFNSSQGIGSTFHFTIPFILASKQISNITNREDNLIFNEKKTILVTEDNESNYKLIFHLLNEVNANVVRASNGQEAVDYLLTGNTVDLILMDIKMPVMDGYTAVKKIRELNFKMPIIAQTAYADDNCKVLESGFNGFLAKPFDKKKLFQAIMDVSDQSLEQGNNLKAFFPG